ncbi:hypothetical protein C8R44DRAFT_115463 [Mycena epipterygia]|nr:hypothetical protein C8R44DRAFT_115463 [Mycena epipterygia]
MGRGQRVRRIETSPCNSQQASPSASASSGVADIPSSPAASSIIEGEDLSGLVFSRNSIDGTGLLQTTTILLPQNPQDPQDSTSFELLENLLDMNKNIMDVVPQTDFQRFVFQSLGLLRAAAFRISNYPDQGPDIEDAVIFYFVASCWRKIRARSLLVQEAYDFDQLASWTPMESKNLDTNIKITNTFLVEFLTKNGIAGNDDQFPFGADNLTRWTLCS